MCCPTSTWTPPPRRDSPPPGGAPTLLVLAVTLHNIPEGMGGGLFPLPWPPSTGGEEAYARGGGSGVGHRHPEFPRGGGHRPAPAAGGPCPAWKSFLYGSLSGIVEPIFGVLAVLVAGSIQPLMPWLLAFAAGSMMYVVVEELIPEAHLGEHSHIGTLGVMAGFVLMMVLDVALG